MPMGKDVLAFDCEFACAICRSLIGLKTVKAIVQSATGAEVTCKQCGQLYKVLEEGAYPIDGGPVPTEAIRLGAVQPTTEAPRLRFTQSGGSPEQRREPPYVWALRMPDVRKRP